MNPLTRLIAQSLPNQYHKHALEIDSQLRVRGAPLGTLYAIGDAATIETNIVDHLFDFVDEYDGNRDGKISLDEFNAMTRSIKRKFPNSQLHVEKASELFDQFDENHDGVISLNELATMFRELSNKLTALPATAQVADQQGKYLAKSTATSQMTALTPPQSSTRLPRPATRSSSARTLATTSTTCSTSRSSIGASSERVATLSPQASRLARLHRAIGRLRFERVQLRRWPGSDVRLEGASRTSVQVHRLPAKAVYWFVRAIVAELILQVGAGLAADATIAHARLGQARRLRP